MPSLSERGDRSKWFATKLPGGSRQGLPNPNLPTLHCLDMDQSIGGENRLAKSQGTRRQWCNMRISRVCPSIPTQICPPSTALDQSIGGENRLATSQGTRRQCMRIRQRDIKRIERNKRGPKPLVSPPWQFRIYHMIHTRQPEEISHQQIPHLRYSRDNTVPHKYILCFSLLSWTWWDLVGRVKTCGQKIATWLETVFRSIRDTRPILKAVRKCCILKSRSRFTRQGCLSKQRV